MKEHLLRPRQLREMSSTEQAWIGAMIEAEGSVSADNINRSPGYPGWRVHFVNTDVELIATFVRLTGIGQVSLQRPAASKRSACWVWTCGRQKDIEALIDQCLPYAPKLSKAVKAL